MKIKVCSLIIAIIIILCALPISASATASNVSIEKTLSNQVVAKTTFAQEMDAKIASRIENGDIKNFDENEVNHLKEQYTFATSKEEKAFYSSELEKFGIYIFNEYIDDDSNGFSDVTLISPYDDSNASINSLIGSFPTSSSSDVTVTIPTVFYDSVVKEWTVTCGGQWKNNNYKPYFGIGKYIGDSDAFGVGYTHIQSSYSTCVKSAYAYIADQNGGNRITTTNRSDGDGANGFGFRLPDQLKTNPDESVMYIGYKWYGSCTYDTYFSYYGCLITGYYIHTYSNAEIDTISFGISDNIAGVNASISNSSKSFSAYSSDLKWGNW